MSIAETSLYLCKRFKISAEQGVRLCAQIMGNSENTNIRLKRESQQRKNIKHSYHPFIAQQVATQEASPAAYSNAFATIAQSVKFKPVPEEQLDSFENTIRKEISTLNRNFKYIKKYYDSLGLQLTASTLHDIMQEYDQNYHIYSVQPFINAHKSSKNKQTYMTAVEHPQWQHDFLAHS